MNRKFIVTLFTIAFICASIKANSEFHSQHQQSFAVNDSVISDSTIARNGSVSATADSVKTDGTSGKKKTKKPELGIEITVMDFLTHQNVDSLECELLWAKDSTFVDSCDVYYVDYRKAAFVNVTIRQLGDYLFRMRADGYRTKYVPFSIKKFHKHELYRQLKDVYMHRLPKEREVDLDEVVVKATKLKFYMDGDTIVYDADAFNLAEGSMLDGLIKNLPGTTITKDGEIMVNGKKVDSMLLNGKDFFDSDRNLLLENLPAYMVKNVQVFERVPEEVKGTAREKTTEKSLVMNVKLKKEYNGGWIANVEGGIGTPYEDNWSGKRDTKFLGRGVALHFDDRSRFSLFFNANNLNDYRNPGENDGEWSPIQQSEGLLTTYKMGVNGMYEFAPQSKYQGSLSGSYTDGDNESMSSGVNFLNKTEYINGQVVESIEPRYFKSYNASRNYRYDIDARNKIDFVKDGNIGGLFKRVYGYFEHYISYNKSNMTSNSAETSLREDVASQLGKSWLDSIMAPTAGELLKKYAINRTMNEAKNMGHNLQTSLRGYGSVTPLYNDKVDFRYSGNIGYSDSQTDTYRHNFLDQTMNGGNLVKQNSFSPNTNSSLNGNYSISSGIQLGKHNISVGYVFSHNKQKSNAPIYTLEKLKEWDDFDSHPMGMLPSEEELLQSMDSYNSKTQTTTQTTHSPQIGYRYYTWMEKSKMSFNFNFDLDFPFAHETMYYWQGGQADDNLKRNTSFVTPNISMYLYGEQSYVYLYGNINTRSPSLVYQLDVKDTLNPLRRNEYNPDLKNSVNYNLNTYWRVKIKRAFLYGNGSFYYTHNQVGSKRVVDSNNATIYKPANIDGNWSLNIKVGADTPLDKGEKWRLRNDLDYRLQNSVDFNGTGTNTNDAERSVVKTHNVRDGLGVTYHPSSKFEIGAKTNIDWQHAEGNRMGFETINTFTFNYGLTTQIELPWNMQIATDLTMYSRRGYKDTGIKRDELVWNARLSKRMMKGKFIVQLDGFDMLGNLSNVRTTLNAQAHSETFYNVIPSYCLLHAIWRFNKNPKKKE